ncbi:S9 family peptidase [Pseudidiomarina marina]|uniref:S9 family peptidase n=1 Tax=Pseudidiomarina marina TaxID=502366 RepID=UPI00384B4B98
MKLTQVIALSLPLTFLATAQAEKIPFTVADTNAVIDVAAPSLSADGELLSFTVSSEHKPTDAFTSDVWLANSDGSQQRNLSNTPEHDEWSPAFSPDQRHLTWLATDENDLTQVFAYNLEDNTTKQLTKLEHSVDGYLWSPDGKQLLLTMTVGAPKPNEAGTPAPVVVNRFKYLEDGVGYLTSQRTHLFVYDIASQKLTQVTEGDYDHWLPSWAPNGKSIAYFSRRDLDTHRSINYDVFVRSLEGERTEKQVSTFSGSDGDPYWISPPAWSPDSQQLVWLQGGEQKWMYYHPWQMMLADLNSGKTRKLAHLDRNIYLPRFAPDGKSVYALLEEKHVTPLIQVDIASGEVNQLTHGKHFLMDYALSADGSQIVVQRGTDNQPFELYSVTQDKPLTNFNSWVDNRQLAKTTTFSYDSDGHTIDGFLVLPADYQGDKPLPTIFRVHGGPVYQFSHEFMIDWQIYAANGFAVVGINPRGSSGKGFDFAKHIYADWGSVDVQDLLAGIRHLSQEKIIDANHLGLGGWSYGGILTNWTIAQTNVFKAAVSGAGTANTLGNYGVDQYPIDYEIELGTPWDNFENYVRASYPFLNANKIKTPTLYQCSEDDLNVICGGSMQMYQALKSVGTPTQLIIYPGQNHGISVPSYLTDRMQRNLDWYSNYLLNNQSGQ